MLLEKIEELLKEVDALTAQNAEEADGLHRHTCLQRNEAGERVSSRMVGIGEKDALHLVGIENACFVALVRNL